VLIFQHVADVGNHVIFEFNQLIGVGTQPTWMDATVKDHLHVSSFISVPQASICSPSVLKAPFITH